MVLHCCAQLLFFCLHAPVLTSGGVLKGQFGAAGCTPVLHVTSDWLTDTTIHYRRAQRRTTLPNRDAFDISIFLCS
jgi:hypothetical protein